MPCKLGRLARIEIAGTVDTIIGRLPIIQAHNRMICMMAAAWPKLGSQRSYSALYVP